MVLRQASEKGENKNCASVSIHLAVLVWFVLLWQYILSSLVQSESKCHGGM